MRPIIMELDTHCLIVLGQLMRDEISYMEAEYEIDTHWLGLFQLIIEQGALIENYPAYA